MKKNEMVIFTDGSSRGNPGPGGWGSVVLFFDKKKKEERVIELGGGEIKTTNNRMEMSAVIESLKFIEHDLLSNKDGYSVMIYTDSSYLIKGATEWIKGWQRKNWIKKDGAEVKNKDLWKDLSELIKRVSISWEHVPGHAGVVGNERADEIACCFADSKNPSLKTVAYKDYSLNLSLPSDSDRKKLYKNKKNKTSKSKKAYSYVSSVKGQVSVHGDWDSCKKRVAGVSGALFKKVYSPKEERELIENWTV